MADVGVVFAATGRVAEESWCWVASNSSFAIVEGCSVEAD